MFMKNCPDCAGAGFLLATEADTGKQAIQRCDTCSTWATDETMLVVVYQLALYAVERLREK